MAWVLTGTARQCTQPMRRYLDLIRTPGVAPLLVAGAIGRLPYGMNILALILLLRAEGLSYAEVGVVTGASGLAVGLTAPLLGRAVDRSGQTRVLVSCACVALAAEVALAVAALSGAGVIALVAIALVGGASNPPVSSSMRTLWPELVGRERLDTAFAFDALQLEIFFITGPLIVVGIAAAASPQAAFLSGAAMLAGGAIAFAATPASRRWRPTRGDGPAPPSALVAPGMRTLVAAFVLGGVSLGALEIAIPAFAERDVREHDERVHGDHPPQPVAVHPERPARLRGEHEDPDVVRIRDAEHGERVRGPPPAAAGVERAEQAERREPGQQRHEGVGARLGGVEHAYGWSARIAAATRPSARPAVRSPSAYPSGTSAIPDTSDGSRTHHVGSPMRAVAQASTKCSGGVFSVSRTTLSTSPSPWSWTIPYMISSSPSRLSRISGSRSASASSVRPPTTARSTD